MAPANDRAGGMDKYYIYSLIQPRPADRPRTNRTAPKRETRRRETTKEGSQDFENSNSVCWFSKDWMMALTSTVTAEDVNNGTRIAADTLLAVDIIDII